MKSVPKRQSAAGYRVFLSHSDKDRWIAKPDSVRNGIEKCDEFVVLLSRYSKDRPWVLIEIGAAWGLRKPIIAIIDKIGPKEMPDILNPYKAIDLNDFDQYISQFLRRAKVRR